MEQKIAARISRAIEENVFPGCVAGFLSRKSPQTVLAFGRQTYDPASPPLHENSIFDVASITKAIPTSCLALRSMDAGKLRLDDRVNEYLPKLRNSYKDKLLVRHLLTQTVAYGFRLSALKDLGAKGILNAILTTEFAAEPGSTFFYSNATSILLGMVVEKLREECLAVSAQREFFDPLGMTRTSFFPEEFPTDEIVPTEVDPWRGRTIVGEVHDESAWVLRQSMVAGSAGLFSTVPDILRFLGMMLDDGFTGGTRYFSKDCIEQMCTNQVAHLGLQTGLGWELNQARYMGTCCSQSTIGKTGFTGCVCMCDMQRRCALVILSNCTFPSRKPDTRAIDGVRRDIADMVFSEIPR
jgi:CubicO group peptidase (beta-lactamase class C family)